MDLIKVLVDGLLARDDLTAAMNVMREINQAFSDRLVAKIKQEIEKVDFNQEDEFWNALSDYGIAVGGNPAKFEGTPQERDAVGRLEKLLLGKTNER